MVAPGIGVAGTQSDSHSTTMFPGRRRPRGNVNARRRARALGAAAGTSVSLACGGEGPAEPAPTGLAIEPPAALVVGVGSAAQFAATARGPDGGVVAARLEWSVADPDVASVSARGLATGLANGTTTVTARAQGISATAQLEVFVPERVGRYEPGRSYYGRRNYVQYVPGELPVIVSAGHGGAAAPSEIGDRRYGVMLNDRNTLELALAVREELIALTGLAPHLVVSHLARAKLDPNRDIEEAAQGNPYAEQAWREYHDWIRDARATVSSTFAAHGSGEGLYLDIHGHSHEIDRVELGYLLPAEQLNGPDASLNSLGVVRCSSIRELGRDSPLPFAHLLRGATSFGGLLQAEGVASVPSPAAPSPGSSPYFRGGYSTRIHGSVGDGEVISGIQLEHQYAGVRDTPANRRSYAAKAARAIRAFMLDHVGYFKPPARRGPVVAERPNRVAPADETDACP